MTVLELARAVAGMRSAQKQYFQLRTKHALVTARQMEASVDRAIDFILRQSSALADRPATPGAFLRWVSTRPDPESARDQAERIRESWGLPRSVEDWSADAVVAVYREMLFKPKYLKKSHEPR